MQLSLEKYSEEDTLTISWPYRSITGSAVPQFWVHSRKMDSSHAEGCISNTYYNLWRRAFFRTIYSHRRYWRNHERSKGSISRNLMLFVLPLFEWMFQVISWHEMSCWMDHSELLHWLAWSLFVQWKGKKKPGTKGEADVLHYMRIQESVHWFMKDKGTLEVMTTSYLMYQLTTSVYFIVWRGYWGKLLSRLHWDQSSSPIILSILSKQLCPFFEQQWPWITMMWERAQQLENNHQFCSFCREKITVEGGTTSYPSSETSESIDVPRASYFDSDCEQDDGEVLKPSRSSRRETV